MAHVCCTPCTWSPKLELDGVPIAWDTSMRNYQGGQAGHIAKALAQPLLLPRDMEAYKRFSQQKLFLSLKRDLAMVSTLILFFFFFFFFTFSYFYKFFSSFYAKSKNFILSHRLPDRFM